MTPRRTSTASSNDYDPGLGIGSFAFFLCSSLEQAFIKACRNLRRGRENAARVLFAECTRIDPKFPDAWFMFGFIELTNGRVERAREAFLHVLADKDYFQGLLVLRFLPKFRPCANLFEDFLFPIAPTTADVAAITAKLYMNEKKTREAKKIIHPAFVKYGRNVSVQAVWAQSMLADDSPDEVIKEIDRGIECHKGNTELDLVVTYMCGRAYLDTSNFRSGIAHLESCLHHAQGKNPALIDRFKIAIAKAYEDREYLLSTLKTLGTVEDRSTTYEPGKSVDFKLSELVDKINKLRNQGIIKNMEFTYEYHRLDKRSTPGFLEFERPAESSEPR